MKLIENRYDVIEESAVKLFMKLNISKIPIDPFEIVDALGIKFETYSQLTELTYEQKNVDKQGWILL